MTDYNNLLTYQKVWNLTWSLPVCSTRTLLIIYSYIWYDNKPKNQVNLTDQRNCYKWNTCWSRSIKVLLWFIIFVDYISQRKLFIQVDYSFYLMFRVVRYNKIYNQPYAFKLKSARSIFGKNILHWIILNEIRKHTCEDIPSAFDVNVKRWAWE